MVSGTFASAVALTVAFALLMAGAAAAWRSANIGRRLAGIVCAQIGAILALAILGAPPTATIGAVAICFAYTALGVAMIVRLQEGYASTEANEVDSADERSEPAEPGA